MNKEPLPKGAWWKIARFWIIVAVVMVFVVAGLGVLLGPLTCSIRKAQQDGCIQTARTIAVSLYSYSQDHNGKYPEGRSSTEVFQQLIDGGYTSDPAIYYMASLRMPGKFPPHGDHLKPENVSWDVTVGVDSSSPDKLPLVFLTGYKILYQAGTSAETLHPPPPRTWEDWWNGLPPWEPFMAVAYKGNSASSFIANANGTIPDFIPADFDPKGKTYRQLTP